MKSAALTQVRALHVMMVFVQVIEWNGIHGNLFDSSFKLSLTELIPNVNLEDWGVFGVGCFLDRDVRFRKGL